MSKKPIRTVRTARTVHAVRTNTPDVVHSINTAEVLSAPVPALVALIAPSAQEAQHTPSKDERKNNKIQTENRLPKPPKPPKPVEGYTVAELEEYQRAEGQRLNVYRRRLAAKKRKGSPHKIRLCAICRSSPKMIKCPLTVREIAEKSMLTESMVYRVLQTGYGEKQSRGHESLRILRRIAHDGLGITLDQLASTILD